jgi:hypothetical protein
LGGKNPIEGIPMRPRKEARFECVSSFDGKLREPVGSEPFVPLLCNSVTIRELADAILRSDLPCGGSADIAPILGVFEQ